MARYLVLVEGRAAAPDATDAQGGSAVVRPVPDVPLD
jgi:hypothetical protein